MTFDPGVSEVQAASTQATNQIVQQAASQAVPPSGSGQMINVNDSTFNSMGDFQAKYPELYQAFIYSWAVAAVNDAKRSNDRLIETMKEAERQYN